MKRIVIAVSVVALLSFTACGPTSSQNSTPASSQNNVATKPPEQQLAFLDGNRNPTENDADVKRIRSLLQSISTKMKEPLMTIADDTNRATQVLKNHGVTMTNLAFLVEADKATELPDKVKKGTTYREIVTLLVSVAAEKAKKN